jgi:hypothetical protein
MFTNIIKSICCLYHNNNFERIKTNYECKNCASSGRPPNILGNFIKINDSQVKCNGCNTIFKVVNVLEEQNIPVVSCTIERWKGKER